MENKTLKICVPSELPGGLNALPTTRFGRCPLFTIINLENNSIINTEIVENPGFQAQGGAGPLAVQTVANLKADVIIGGHYGPNAINAIKRLNIAAYGPGTGNIQEILNQYLANSLTKMN